MKKSLIILALAAAALFAAPVNQSGKADDIDVKVTTDKDMNVGANTFKIKLSKAGQEIKDAKVKIRLFMPEMPGMPAMSEDAEAKYVGDSYVVTPSFSMGGGWQVTVTVTQKAQKAKRYKFNVNI